jgi:hypothetical protein
VKRYLFSSFLLLIYFIISAPAVTAISWEIHPGIITACEYSDNYFGVPSSLDPKSDTTYKIGPSLDFRIASQKIALNFSGYATKDYNKRNTQDDSDEVFIESGLNLIGISQLMNLNYSYQLTTQRQTLDQTWGEYSYHTGVVEYRKDFTDSDSLNLRYTREQEYAPDDTVTSNSNNLFSNSSEILLELTPKQHDRFNISGIVTDYKYTNTNRDNIVTTVSDVSWMHNLTQEFHCGLEGAYTSNSPSRNPNSDIYEGFMRGEYQATEYLRVIAKVGYSWLKQEIEGTNGMTSGELRIERLTDSDNFILSGSKDFSYDYTTGSTYGMYSTTSGNLSWEHFILRNFSSAITGHITMRIPESSTQVGSTDYYAGLTLNYIPAKWATVSGSYNYLETTYNDIPETYTENTETRRENRYTINIEVRY